VHPYADFNSNNTLTDRYLYGPAVDMILADLEADGDLFWYLTDHLGSVRDIANTTGSVVDHIKYASFGHVISESQPSNGDRFKFTARELESALDDYFYRARWHDDDVGRFISEDPIGFGAGDPNLYRYVGNRPTIQTDLLGLDPPHARPPDESWMEEERGLLAKFVIPELAKKGPLPPYFVGHCLQDRPKNLEFRSADHVVVKTLRQSPEYQRLIRDIVKSYPRIGPKVKFRGSGILQIPGSETNLFFSFGKLEYKYTLTKGTDDTYALKMTFTDIYDFHILFHEEVPGGASFPELMVGNMLVIEQHLGVINGVA
jgi:RHS repeat-associated protein